MVLSDDYTPKYAVAEGRLIPLSLAAVRGGYRGFFPPPSGNSRWDLSRIREKVAYLPPRAAGRGRDPGFWAAPDSSVQREQRLQKQAISDRSRDWRYARRVSSARTSALGDRAVSGTRSRRRRLRGETLSPAGRVT